MVLMSKTEAQRLDKRPLATLMGWAMASGHPDRIASIPAESARIALEKAGMGIDDIDLIEVNAMKPLPPWRWFQPSLWPAAIKRKLRRFAPRPM